MATTNEQARIQSLDVIRGVAVMGILSVNIVLAWSKPWLDRYHYGPFEWAWRSLARGEVQPMQRNGRTFGYRGKA